MIGEKDFLKEKEMLLDSIENNTSEHWKNYYKNVPIECIYDDLVIDINEIKRLQSQLEQKEKQLNDIKEYAVDKVNKSFLVDMGLSENRSHRLFTETVIELQKIIDIIERNNSNE